MQTFTAMEYLYIDLANNADEGLDKEVYENRLGWAESSKPELKHYATDREWKEKPLFLKALSAIEATENDESIGHLVGFDAASSGLQINSVLTSCWSGCEATGLVNQSKRANAYKDVTEVQQKILGSTSTADYKSIKQAAMTVAYGSDAQPEKLYGKGTTELDAFYQAMWEVLPGAMNMRDLTLQSWQSMALQQSWTMPDGHKVNIKNYVTHDSDIRVDELNGTGFKYNWSENEGTLKGKANAANMTHSADAWLLRSLIRLCSYDKTVVNKAEELLNKPHSTDVVVVDEPNLSKFKELLEMYKQCRVADVSILPYLNETSVTMLSPEHANELRNMVKGMLQHEPFDVITIHDDFKCHPNYMNFLRKHYNRVMANLCRGRLLASMLYEVNDMEVPENEPCGDKKLASIIMDSNYAIT